MNVVVTGGAGYVGSRVTAHLLSRGISVTVFDKLVYGAQALLPFKDNALFRLVVGDIRDRSALADAMRGSNVVLHLAAVVGEAACELDPEATIEINRTAALEAMELAEALDVERFVFFSTCSNYGVSNPHVLADEECELKPLSLYAKTKVAVELAALGKRWGNAVTVLRLGTICGLSARMRFDLLVSEMARAAALGVPIDVYKPEAWRPYLHIADAVDVAGHVLGCGREKVAGRVFNVVGENYQKRGLVELVRRYYPRTEISITAGTSDNRDYRVTAARIERELGFSSKRTVEEAFLEVASAVSSGVFVDPFWAGHSAIPLDSRRSLIGARAVR